MTALDLTFRGVAMQARADGALLWPAARVLIVSDLHLGKSERMARRGGVLLPPYDTAETLARLARAIDACAPATVICLGDSFDDCSAQAALDGQARARLGAMMAGRRWIWVAGNHDPAPAVDAGWPDARALGELALGPLVLRHVAQGRRDAPGAPGEVSGHYHPKARLPGTGAARPCFVLDEGRIILPAFGAYTGGLAAQDAAIMTLLGPRAMVILTGRRAIAAPLPRTGAPQATGARRSPR